MYVENCVPLERYSLLNTQCKESICAGELIDPNLVAKCWEVFVKEASSVALNKTWSCLYKVKLLKVLDNVRGGTKSWINISNDEGDLFRGRCGGVKSTENGE